MERGTFRGDRVILQAFDDIQTMCDTIHLPKSITDTAKHLYRRTESDRIFAEKGVDAVIAAAIYCACKFHGLPRTLLEICQLSDVNRHVLGRCTQEMQRAYGLNLNHEIEAGVSVSVNAVDLVGRFCNHLGLSLQIAQFTAEVASIVRAQDMLAGKSPITVAAACIYMTSRLMGKAQSVQDVSRITGASQNTIMKAYRDLLNLRSEILTVRENLFETESGIYLHHSLQPPVLARYPKVNLDEDLL
jgi:transcription initiation factor TFIIB